jgi:predicted permease
MLEKILGALLPAVITILLGYFAARHHDFKQKEVPTLNRMVMSYALPLSLFVGVVSAGRAELLADLPLVAFLAAAFIGMYAAVLLLGVFAFRCSPSLSALRALTAAAPSTALSARRCSAISTGTRATSPLRSAASLSWSAWSPPR